ncbi:hypothetical protein C9E89_017635 [Acinetobacter sichuanensis]|nr:hypothetical protein C9E89_017635 [Acinetobacter sichuanensis]
MSSLVAMTDEELSETQGQALYSLNRQDQGGLSFYTLGMEANIGLNANIKNLQLGCGGVNSGSKAGCDIDIQNVSFGCIANASGTCITIPKSDSRQPDGAVQEAQAGDKAQGQMKDFNLTNPFYQFAIKNADSASTREVVGVRIGAAEVEGPLSFGNLASFSGYLTGTANLTMRGETDVSPTCKAPANCATSAGRSQYTDASAYLGLNDAEILNWGVAYVSYRNITADYGQGKNGNPSEISRKNLIVSVNGNRVTQAQIAGIKLGGVVDDIIYGSATTDPLALRRRDIGGILGWLANGFADALLPLLRDGVANYIKDQLATGLGTTKAQLDSYVLPYNLSNVHQLNVKSNTFGLALSKQAIQYPGYVQAVNAGWSMYIPNGFELNINQKTSSLVANIAGSADARNGNITMLEAPYRNCYGSLTFC